MKKILSLCLAVLMLAACVSAFASCGDSGEKKMKVGFIFLHDENSTYDNNFLQAAKAACEAKGVEMVVKKNIPESSKCKDAADDLVAQGCTVVFADSFGHEDFMIQAAKEHKDVQFCHATGTKAHTEKLDNFHNAFTGIYEARYVGGVVAGMKLQQLIDEGKVEDKNKNADGKIKIGYVGAYPYAEVVSGYTAFFLGIRSIVPNVTMEVMYTNSWFDIDKEGAAAEALVAKGCVIIGQHADSTGAPAAVQKLQDAGTICYSIGYNIDMLPTAPTAALTSATNVWSVFYKELFEAAMNGEEIASDWAKGYDDGAVAVTEFGPSCAAGTAEKVAEVEAALRDGSLKVFDTATFTVNGETVTSAPCDMTIMDWATGTVAYQGETYEGIVDGAFEESTFRSAPYFTLRIDGIVEDAQ